ncbi:unnamed protein product [Symbiodinium sp. KB8]|nr:unnamed protein product [Symbiodinium sp. KB8]
MRARHAPTPVGEVIALVVFVGYSVTYALHIAHNYNQVHVNGGQVENFFEAMELADDLAKRQEKARKRQADREQAKAARKRANLNQEEGEGVDGVELAVTDADQEARTRVAVLHVGGATLSSALQGPRRMMTRMMKWVAFGRKLDTCQYAVLKEVLGTSSLSLGEGGENWMNDAELVTKMLAPRADFAQHEPSMALLRLGGHDAAKRAVACWKKDIFMPAARCLDGIWFQKQAQKWTFGH